jgi:two-component system, NtrC family, response regulator AtoC
MTYLTYVVRQLTNQEDRAAKERSGVTMFRRPEELQSLVDIYDQPFIIIDDDHRVVVANRAFQSAFRTAGSQVCGIPCHQMMAERHGPRPCGSQGHACPFADTFAHQVPRTSTFTHRDGDGREHLVRTQAHPLRTHGGRILVGILMQLELLRDPRAAEEGGCPRSPMVGQSAAFREMLDRLLRAANSDAPVLLQGETGTGKELAADFVHRHSARHQGPFQTIDCSVLTGELFESEVFGHERGAFTGSVREKRGLFELADGGTLFLDEIGEVPPPLQAKLLRMLESGEYRRLGSVRTRRANVRIICATNRELLGSPLFRSDLYYRIACVSVRLPSLSDRRSDIPLLAVELLERIGQSAGQRYSIDEAAVQVLRDQAFPGNIRELRNILWVAAVNAPGGHIGIAQIAAALPIPTAESHFNPIRLPLAPTEHPEHPSTGSLSLRHVWDAGNLAAVLRRHRGNRRAAALELGVSERTIYRKLRELGLN